MKQTALPPSAPQKLDIIAVDDMRVQRYLVHAFLSTQGHQIRTATDGQKAFKMAIQSTPDLLITDLEMPGGGGFELIRSIRNSIDDRLRKIPIIVCSSQCEIQSLNSALDYGANFFVTKPLHCNELYLAIKNLNSSEYLRV